MADTVKVITQAADEGGGVLAVPCWMCDAEPGQPCKASGPFPFMEELLPHVMRTHLAALVSQARADGAAKERERIAAACEAEAAGHIDAAAECEGDTRALAVNTLTGFRAAGSAFIRAATIARSTS